MSIDEAIARLQVIAEQLGPHAVVKIGNTTKFLIVKEVPHDGLPHALITTNAQDHRA